MGKLRSNVLANFVGQGWTALLQLVALPVYIKLVGIEAYGLIAFYVTLQVTTQVFDMGLGQTLNRELARCGAVEGGTREMRDVVRTMERIYLVILPVAACVLLLLAPVLASHVINPDSLGRETVLESLQLMAILVPLQWAAGLYSGALMGLERQVMTNLLRAVFGTLGTLGAIAILALVSPSVQAFLAWQILVASAYLVTLGVALYRGLPSATTAGAARFRPEILGRIWRFAAGMAGISVGGVVFAQLDRWAIIGLTSLETFGYYSVAVSVAGALYFVITPMFTALFPRFAGLVAAEREGELRALYDLGTQAMVCMVLPLGVVVSLFAHDIIVLWTGNPAVAMQAAPIASILVLGTAVNGVMNLPYAIQLAFGWTRLAFMLVLSLLAAFLPAFVVLVVHFGPIGAAFAWLGLNVVYFAVGASLTHRYFMPARGMRWLMDNVVPGLVAGVAVVAAGRLISPAQLSGIPGALFLLVLTLLAIVAACVAGAQSRKWLLARMHYT